MIIPYALSIRGVIFTAIRTFFIIIQLVIRLCNAFMKLCCDPCHSQVSIFSISEMMVINVFYNISRIVRWILK